MDSSFLGNQRDTYYRYVIIDYLLSSLFLKGFVFFLLIKLLNCIIYKKTNFLQELILQNRQHQMTSLAQIEGPKFLMNVSRIYM